MVRPAVGEMPQLSSSIANISKQYQYEPETEQFYQETETFDMQDARGGAAPMGGQSLMHAAVMPSRGMTDVMPTGNFHAQPRGFKMAIRALRKVKQYLTDRNDNIPLNRRILYEGPEFITDLSDGELVYNVPVMDILAKHNEYRVTVRDKTYKDKEVFLEEARPGELCLTTVVIANI